MPHLDGVSATVCIREIRPHIPIIAMTSNIRADDIDMYFRYGQSLMSRSILQITKFY
jgi:osomolarity two-component system response regulator SKN7